MAKPSPAELQKAAAAVDLDGFDYEVTLEDPKVYARPWKMKMPIHRQKDAPLLEYECHALLEEAGISVGWDRR